MLMDNLLPILYLFFNFLLQCSTILNLKNNWIHIEV